MRLVLGVLVFDGFVALLAIWWTCRFFLGGSRNSTRDTEELVFIAQGGILAVAATLACVWPGWAV